MVLSNPPGATVCIYVSLMDEGVPVWRPVRAEAVKGDVFRILPDQAYDRETERWQFEPGDVVRCQTKTLDMGRVSSPLNRA